jgi:two-component system, response regulator RegA
MNAPEAAPTVLVVDDDEPFRNRLSRALSDRGFQVQAHGSVEDAVAHLAESPEYAVIDLRLGIGSGLSLLKVLRDRAEGTRALMLTGYGSIPTAIEATRLGAIGYLAKPTDAESIIKALVGGEREPADPMETPSLARAEWEYIHRVLADVSGNVSEAARRLGVHRRSLQRKLHKRPPVR